MKRFAFFKNMDEDLLRECCKALELMGLGYVNSGEAEVCVCVCVCVSFILIFLFFSSLFFQNRTEEC